MCTQTGKTMTKLTDDERRMVEEHMKLVHHTVYKLANKGWLKQNQIEDAMQDGMIGLMKAVRYYDAGTGYAFSSLAVKCIEQCVLLPIQRDWRRSQKHPVISLDEPMPEKFAREGLRREEVVPSGEDLEEEHLDGYAETLIRKLEQMKRDKNVEILRMYLGGKKLVEIAEATGTTKQNVQQRMRQLRPMLAEMMSHA